MTIFYCQLQNNFVGVCTQANHCVLHKINLAQYTVILTKVESNFFFEFPVVVRLFAREDANHQVCIAGLTERHVHNVEELMEVGTQTKGNRFRSHTV